MTSQYITHCSSGLEKRARSFFIWSVKGPLAEAPNEEGTLKGYARQRLQNSSEGMTHHRGPKGWQCITKQHTGAPQLMPA